MCPACLVHRRRSTLKTGFNSVEPENFDSFCRDAVMNATDFTGEAASCPHKFHILHGGEDRIVDIFQSRTFVDEVPGRNSKWWKAPGNCCSTATGHACSTRSRRSLANRPERHTDQVAPRVSPERSEDMAVSENFSGESKSDFEPQSSGRRGRRVGAHERSEFGVRQMMAEGVSFRLTSD